MSGRTEADAARDIISQQGQIIDQLQRRIEDDRHGERLCLEAISRT